MPLTKVAAGTYYLIVDGYEDDSGPFTLEVRGTIANGASCEQPLAVSGALVCAAGFTCKGTAGSRTCQRAECSDGIDNNGNVLTDYPNDPGCSTPDDDSEVDVCPGVMCPACSNMTDDDADT